MPNLLRQTNQEYGTFCGYASEVARNWFNNQGEVSATAILEEGRRVGVFDDSPEPSVELFRRGGWQTYDMQDLIRVTIDSATRPPRGTIPLSAWDWNPATGVCQIVFIDNTVMEIRDPSAVPPGVCYARSARPMTEAEVNFCREAYTQRGYVEWTQPAEIEWRSIYDQPVVNDRSYRLSLREYELPGNGIFQNRTLTILH